MPGAIARPGGLVISHILSSEFLERSLRFRAACNLGQVCPSRLSGYSIIIQDMAKVFK